MKRHHLLLLFFSLTLVWGKAQNQPWDPEKLYAWCIVPFDKEERSPSERLSMLKELSINNYAYDWREEHLSEMSQEFKLASEMGIEVSAVWMWIDPLHDAPGQLSPGNEQVFTSIAETGLNTTLWVSFHPAYFEDLEGEARLEKASIMIYDLYRRCQELNCKLALYNHGDWFGDPRNQVRIIKQLGRYDIGLVYNFHHAHEQLDFYPELVDAMLPFLVAVNINGMQPDGPKILPVGEGTEEKQMIQVLLDKGYKGPFGILGHVEDADVKLILQNNLAGIKNLFPSH